MENSESQNLKRNSGYERPEDKHDGASGKSHLQTNKQVKIQEGRKNRDKEDHGCDTGWISDISNNFPIRGILIPGQYEDLVSLVRPLMSISVEQTMESLESLAFEFLEGTKGLVKAGANGQPHYGFGFEVPGLTGKVLSCPTSTLKFRQQRVSCRGLAFPNVVCLWASICLDNQRLTVGLERLSTSSCGSPSSNKKARQNDLPTSSKRSATLAVELAAASDRNDKTYHYKLRHQDNLRLVKFTVLPSTSNPT
ncbi:unnamed protein product [Dovyalis caffra]|uniref:Uncharacterized protein n=1 Tax=Dovyalis caffra TaxID=77055 RepID=A0AAV1RRZ7_9ROSI|nr:unnamed protein product [Dovyalis caffra]